MVEIAIALAFIYGALARPAAAALGGAWIIGMLAFGPLRLIEHTEILGVAFFLFATGRGPLAFDMALDKLNKPLAPLIPYAVPVLRTSLGIGLTVTAFTEKLWNLPMGLAFLSAYHLNFFPYIGLSGIDDTKFLLIAGTVELLMGLMLITGTYVRLMILRARTGWGYVTLVREVSDSLHLRRFCLIPLTDPVPSESTVRKLTRRLGPEVVAELIRGVITLATRERRFAPRAMRTDSTVVEADVRYPTDAGLAATGVRLLAAGARRLGRAVDGGVPHVRDRSRAVGRRLRAMTRTLRRGCSQRR
jgi:IS5 family transposase